MTLSWANATNRRAFTPSAPYQVEVTATHRRRQWHPLPRYADHDATSLVDVSSVSQLRLDRGQVTVVAGSNQALGATALLRTAVSHDPQLRYNCVTTRWAIRRGTAEPRVSRALTAARRRGKHESPNREGKLKLCRRPQHSIQTTRSTLPHTRIYFMKYCSRGTRDGTWWKKQRLLAGNVCVADHVQIGRVTGGVIREQRWILRGGYSPINYRMMHCRRSNTTVACRAVVGTYQLYHACAGMSDVALGTFFRCLASHCAVAILTPAVSAVMSIGCDSEFHCGHNQWSTGTMLAHSPQPTQRVFTRQHRRRCLPVCSPTELGTDSHKLSTPRQRRR